MLNFWALGALFLVSSCGGVFTGSPWKKDQERQIASHALERLMREEDQTFETQVEDKLISLHSYYVITQRQLNLFEEKLSDVSLENLYQGQHYLSLLAVRTQIDDIEKEFHELKTELHDAKKEMLLKKQIEAFSRRSPVHYRSVENIAYKLQIKLEARDEHPAKSEIDNEYLELEKTREFQVYEKNIEHLSHMMEMNLDRKARKFIPSENENGTLSGQEFPAKVWSLTFSNGPEASVTPLILQKLKAKHLKATFFQEAAKSKSHLGFAKRLVQDGMEVGTQSWSNKELAKVGLMTLEKEITQATVSMEKNLKLDIKFYRLPYGSGMDVPEVRGLIAKNKLIHVFWNVDSLDWVPQSAGRIIKRTKDLMKKTSRDSGIILFHDVHPRSAEASEVIMDHLKQDARRVCPLGTIVEEMNRGEKSVCSQKSF